MPLQRIFIALDTSPTLKRELGDLSGRLAVSKADIRWERTGKLHCTLQFLGDVDESIVGSLDVAVRKAIDGVAPFEISFGDLGFFPDSVHPRVLWVGLDDPEGRLAFLHERLVEETSRLGLRGTEPAFRPHITLGRIRGQRNVTRLTTMAETCTFDHPPVTVREVLIMKSELKPSGSVYTVLRSLPLIA
jgi:RNA 2',3'-cyclic 3'-phosphodiesterase